MISLPVISPQVAPSPANILFGAERRFHVMVKPVGAACNLDCTYCFYLHKDELLPAGPSRRMSDEVLEAHIRQYIAGQDGEQVVFSWQGGEPTLMGLEFFQKVVALEARYQKPGQTIENDLQTNGTLLDDEWCRFLKQHNFLVGLSIDGPQHLHDRYRLTKGGRPTFAQVLAAAKLLHQHGVPFNTLTVVNRINAKHPLEVYRFLRREVGSTYIQFIPCVEPRDFTSVAPQKWDPAKLPVVGTPQARPGHPDSIVTEWSVDPLDWGEFLCVIWDEWLSRDFGQVLVNLFETMVAQSMGLPSQLCIFNEFCGKGLALERDGSLFSCDHYVYPEYRLGNILEQDEADLAFSPQQQQFGFAKRDTLPKMCRECPHLKLCWGECPKHRCLKTKDREPGLNYLCLGLQRFFTHIKRDLPAILHRLRHLPANKRK